MEYIAQIAFLGVLGFFGFLLYRRITQIKKSILLGRDINRSDRPAERWRTMLLVALGQKKMFKKLVPAILHLFIYVGFVVINLEVLEFILDGLLGTHRLFAPALGGFYGILMNMFEFLAVLVMISCVAFLVRRNVIKVPRFTKPEMKGWPSLDGNLILVIELILMLAIFTMNATDQLLQAANYPHYPITGH